MSNEKVIKLLTNLADWTSAFIDAVPEPTLCKGIKEIHIEAKEALAELLAHAEKMAEVEKLLNVYRRKRKVDGLNKRIWDAHEHLKAEEEIDKLEEALTLLQEKPVLCKTCGGTRISGYAIAGKALIRGKPFRNHGKIHKTKESADETCKAINEGEKMLELGQRWEWKVIPVPCPDCTGEPEKEGEN